MKNAKRCRSDGFTLIEILVALAIFGLVVAAIYSGWIAILRASKTGLEAAAQAQRERVAIRTIEEALTASRSFAADLQHYGFVGENGSEAKLSFVARLPKSFPRSGKFGDFDVRRLTFSVEDGSDGGRQLVLRQSTLLIDMDSDEKEHPLVLAKNVDKFELGFWDRRKGVWVDTWTDNFTNQLPPLVKVTLTLLDHPHSIKAAEEIVRIISVPSVTVAPTCFAT